MAEKIYEQYQTGSINPAVIIADYAESDEHTEVAAMFSADLDDSLNNLEREKTLNDIVIRIKGNSLNDELNKTVDPRRMQEIILETAEAEPDSYQFIDLLYRACYAKKNGEEKWLRKW